MTMSRRTILSALGVSVLLNLFFAGFVLVPRLLEGDERTARLGAIAAIGQAPSEVMELVERQLHEDRDRIHTAFGELRQARQAVRSAMRAEPLDRAALDAAFARLRERSITLQEGVHASVAAAIEKAPAELRQKIESRRGTH